MGKDTSARRERTKLKLKERGPKESEKLAVLWVVLKVTVVAVWQR